MVDQKATWKSDERPRNAKNLSGEKETIYTLTAVAFHADHDTVEPVSVRIYRGRSRNASRVLATVWLNGKGRDHAAGHGKAEGYGYHKTSAAMQEAIDSAGVKLSEPIDGRGDGAMLDATKALASLLGYTEDNGYHVHVVTT